MPGQSNGHMIPSFLITKDEKATIKAFGMFTNGGFPIVVLESNPKLNKEKINGRFIQLNGTKEQSDLVLARLDAYEGVDRNLFFRKEVEVAMENTLSVAWVYSISPSLFSDVKKLLKVPKNDWTKMGE